MKTSVLVGLLILLLVSSCKNDENGIADIEVATPSYNSTSRSSGFSLTSMGQYHNDLVQLAFDYETVHGSKPTTSQFIDTADTWLSSQYSFNVKPVPSTYTYSLMDSLLDGLIDEEYMQEITADLLTGTMASEIYNSDELGLLKRLVNLSTTLDTNDLKDSLAVYDQLIASITWTGNNGEVIKSAVDIYDHSLTLWTSPTLTVNPLTASYCSVCVADATTYVYEFTTNLSRECNNYAQCDTDTCPDCLKKAGINVDDAIDAHHRVAVALAAIASFGSS